MPQKKSGSPPPGAGSCGQPTKDSPAKDGPSKYNTEAPSNRRKELLEAIKTTNIHISSIGKSSDSQTAAGGATVAAEAEG